MFRVVFLSFLLFASVVVLPTQSYAISLDDDEEDAEDVADLLSQAKEAAKSESFDKAERLMREAKQYGIATDEMKDVQRYISKKKEAKAERERKERERLARLKREREERARRARLAQQRSYSSGGVPSYQVTCSSGKTVIIYKKNGTWYTGGLGHMGHGYDSWSRDEVAEYVCK